MNVLFLCTGNSCRSQIAEAWASKLGAPWLKAHSAGIESHGKNPRAIAVMLETGIDISHQESTTITETMLLDTDCLVTVCGHADEHCPVIPEGVIKEHWPLSDPAKATGSEVEIMEVFRESREDIHQRVKDLIKRLKNLNNS